MHAIEPFQIKQGSRLPVIQRYLLDSDGRPIPVPSQGVAFHVRASGAAGASLVGSALASIVNVASMSVVYAWDLDDTAAQGAFQGEFEAIYAPSQSMRIPDPGFIPIFIGDAVT